jgi:hypothetical protein
VLFRATLGFTTVQKLRLNFIIGSQKHHYFHQERAYHLEIAVAKLAEFGSSD